MFSLVLHLVLLILVIREKGMLSKSNVVCVIFELDVLNTLACSVNVEVFFLPCVIDILHLILTKTCNYI